jgi:hypothetical protein
MKTEREKSFEREEEVAAMERREIEERIDWEGEID